MSADFLQKVLQHKQKINKDKEEYYAELRRKLSKEKLTRYHIFKQAVSKPGRINLIAEIKKASPSRGMLCDNFDVMAIAKIYVDSGADAISILTEEKYFLGKPMYITRVSEHYSIPILTKDFIIHEGQIHETVVCGSSAVLLIAAILKDEELKHLMQTAAQFDLDCLVEVHNEKELDRALACGAEIIGINNRDLDTLKMDMSTCERLIPKVPKGKIIVAESGLDAHEQIVKLKDLGANAALIGETFMKAADMAGKIKEIMHGKS